MIDEAHVKQYCRDPFPYIENYSEAYADPNETWVCHHCDEIRFLPSGMVSIRSKAELIENGRYYSCPANELIFMRKSDHIKLHRKYSKYNYNYMKGVNAAVKINTGKPKLTKHGVFAKAYIEHFHEWPLNNYKEYKRMYMHWKRTGKFRWEEV